MFVCFPGCCSVESALSDTVPLGVLLACVRGATWVLHDSGKFPLRSVEGKGFDCYTEEATLLPPFVYKSVSSSGGNHRPACGG